MRRFGTAVLAVISLLPSACGDGRGRFGLAAPAIESLPQLRAASPGALTVVSGTIGEYSALAKFFKLECYMPEDGSFCPAGVDFLTGGDMNPYKFTSSTLVGAIYHADMYSGGIRDVCRHSSRKIQPSSYAAAQPGGSPTAYFLDYYDLLTCAGSEAWEGAPRTVAYSVDPKGTYQATLTTRYRAPYNGVAAPGQSDVFQVYVALSAGKPTLLAFNNAGASSVFQRTVLLVNLVDHTFAVKYLTSNPGYEPSTIVAVGRGGADRATGQQHPGFYYVKNVEPGMGPRGGEFEGCVNNSDNTFQKDNAGCTSAGVPLAGSTWISAESIANYLAIAPADRIRLAGFLGRFDSAAPLVPADAPSNTTTDPEQNIPKTFTP